MGHLALCALCILVSISFQVQLTSFVIKLSSMATLDDFISPPSEKLLEQFTKDQLLKLASYYDIEIASSEKCLKESVKEALKPMLTENGVLKPAPPSASQSISEPSQIIDVALELRLKELALQELQLQDKQRERLLKEKQMHLEHERFLKELELKQAALLRPP